MMPFFTGLRARACHVALRPLFAMVLCVCVPLLSAPSPADAAPRPQPSELRYELDIHGFNDGEPYRLREAQAQAVLEERGAVVFRFRSSNWMEKDVRGDFVSVGSVKSRFANRTLAALFSVFHIDVDGDQLPEVLIVANSSEIGPSVRYAPTLLKRVADGYKGIWAATIPGQTFRVVDIRDLNSDGAVEVMLSGEAGKSGYYQFHQLAGHTDTGMVTLEVKHVDSVHYLDLDRDGSFEIVVRERIGRRGPAHQWTYIDRLTQWDGAAFVDSLQRFPRYHDVQTLPALVGDLIDHYQATLPILLEKVLAIERVHAEASASASKPPRFRRRLVAALAAETRGQRSVATRRLQELERLYPYDSQLLLALARLHAAEKAWKEVLDVAIRALTVRPRDPHAWWWTGVAFVALAERSSAVASFHNAAQLSATVDEGIAFLKVRRAEPGVSEVLDAAVAQALSELGVKGP